MFGNLPFGGGVPDVGRVVPGSLRSAGRSPAILETGLPAREILPVALYRSLAGRPSPPSMR